MLSKEKKEERERIKNGVHLTNLPYFVIRIRGKDMVEGLVVFTSTTIEDRVLECLGSTRQSNERTRFENGYTISKHNIKGSVYNVVVIRGTTPVARSVQLVNKLGGGAVFLVEPGVNSINEPVPANVKVINSVASAVEAFRLRLSPNECEQLKTILEENCNVTTMRNYMNPETPGDAEEQFANRFFLSARLGQHVRAPDADLFQGAIYFLPAGRVAVVHNSSSEEDADFLLAQHLSLQQDQPTSSSSSSTPSKRGTKRVRKTPPTWESVLKQAEPIAPGLAVCVTCRSYRASICFDCGHQVMCDECIRQMCQLPGVRRACPVCRCESETIIRPILSEVEK